MCLMSIAVFPILTPLTTLMLMCSALAGSFFSILLSSITWTKRVKTKKHSICRWPKELLYPPQSLRLSTNTRLQAWQQLQSHRNHFPPITFPATHLQLRFTVFLDDNPYTAQRIASCLILVPYTSSVVSQANLILGTLCLQVHGFSNQWVEKESHIEWMTR